jgi:hypothetical protein
MNKFQNLETVIHGFFGSTAWTTQNIQTIPANFIKADFETEYIRISILPVDSVNHFGSVGGLVMIDIFTPIGTGTKRTYEIADNLDSLLMGKGHDGVQLFESNLKTVGPDKDSPHLFRTIYSIQFKYFGDF